MSNLNKGQFKAKLNKKNYTQAYGMMIMAANQEIGDSIYIDTQINGKQAIDETIRFCQGDEEECHNRVVQLFTIDFSNLLDDYGATKTAKDVRNAIKGGSSFFALLLIPFALFALTRTKGK